MKKFIANLPIKYKLIVAMLAVVLTAEIITVVTFHATNDKYVNDYVMASSSQIAKMIAERNISNVDFADKNSIQKTLENIKSFEELENVHIYDLKGEILADYNRFSSLPAQQVGKESSVSFTDEPARSLQSARRTVCEVPSVSWPSSGVFFWGVPVVA